MRSLYFLLLFLVLATKTICCQSPLSDANDYQQKITHYRSYISLNPTNINALAHYAYCCVMIGDIPEALSAYHTILKTNPNNEQIIYNIAYALKTADRMQESLTFYDAVLTINPNNDQAVFGKARTLITMGNFADGWPLYRTYLHKAEKKIEPLYQLISSNQLHNKIILLVPEGSFGDTIQFIRYAQILKEYGATVIAMVQKQLLPLLSNCPYIDTLLSTEDKTPPHHAHATLMNMPALCDSTEQTMSQNMPYIFPNPERIAHWRTHLMHNTQFKIGICWQADVHNDVSRPPIGRRGIPLEYVYALADIPGITLYSLQQYDGLEQLEHVPPTFKLHLFDASFDKTHGAFMDTAAVMTLLDLVITVDTSIAHLAGALGVPTYLMLPYQTDWRWITGRSDTPWYPSMRIFKQQKPFDYAGVANEIIQAVKQQINV